MKYMQRKCLAMHDTMTYLCALNPAESSGPLGCRMISKWLSVCEISGLLIAPRDLRLTQAHLPDLEFSLCLQFSELNFR